LYIIHFCYEIKKFKVKKITENESSKKFDLPRISSTILCITGGITFIAGEQFIIGYFHGSSQDIYFTMVIVVAIITIICSLIGLKYQKIGSSLCFIIGIGSLIFFLLIFRSSDNLLYNFRYGISFISGSVLIISGSLIGVIGFIKTAPHNLRKIK